MNIFNGIRSFVAACAVVPVAADAQNAGTSVADAVRFMPVWAWCAIAACALAIVVAMFLSRRTKRTTIIKTRLG